MPRPLRLQDAGYVHHVVCRGNDRQQIFSREEDFLYYCQLIEEARQQFPVKIYNFILMNNHIHLLIEPEEDGSLSKFMEALTKAYAKYFNKTYERSGHVFQGRFKSFLVQAERYFFACSRYIDLNPVKASIVSNPQDWAWSGYRYLAQGEISPIRLDAHPIYEDLGKSDEERRIAYRAVVKMGEQDDLDLLNRRAGVLGDQEFKKSVKNV